MSHLPHSRSFELRTIFDCPDSAGGCFWCMEPTYDELEGEGVLSVRAGISGGHVPNPTYDQVSMGRTGHREVVQVIYDPAQVAYERVLEICWRNVDPFDPGGQFCDRRHQCTSAIRAAAVPPRASRPTLASGSPSSLRGGRLPPAGARPIR